MNYVHLMEQALERNNHEQMREVLRTLTKNNVGEAYYPGLKDLCVEARRRMARATLR